MGATTSDFLLERLGAWGIERLYGYPGDGINGPISARDATFEGIPLCWRSRNEIVAPVFYDPQGCSDGRSAVVLTNRALRNGRGLSLSIRFDPAQLPALFTWRMLGCGTYVMRMEPANCPTIEGRVEAERLGTLPFFEPGESRQSDREFEAIDQTRTLDALLACF